ncbi:hypothetical protein GQ600_8784 [Phytophthora cactorum]|nr:hypothetical protein GQ600_8784 [Phytophthora cactorum]
MEAQKALEERQRRENTLMRDEDLLSRAVEEKERKEQYFKLCRERKRLRDTERRHEANNTCLMQIEDERDEKIRRTLQKAEEYKKTLEQMQKLADRVANKQKDRLQEARNRKLMYDEETRQRRVQQAQLQLDRILEKHEREAMEDEDRRAQNLDVIEARLQDKRAREKRNLSRSAASHGDDYPQFLRLNVEVLMEFVENLKNPPLDLDYEAVEAHLATEHTLTEDKIPQKRGKHVDFSTTSFSTRIHHGTDSSSKVPRA